MHSINLRFHHQSERFTQSNLHSALLHKIRGCRTKQLVRSLFSMKKYKIVTVQISKLTITQQTRALSGSHDNLSLIVMKRKYGMKMILVDHLFHVSSALMMRKMTPKCCSFLQKLFYRTFAFYPAGNHDITTPKDGLSYIDCIFFLL